MSSDRARKLVGSDRGRSFVPRSHRCHRRPTRPRM